MMVAPGAVEFEWTFFNACALLMYKHIYPFLFKYKNWAVAEIKLSST